MRALSKSKKDRIVNLLFSGKTYREIADMENVSLAVISKTRAHVSTINIYGGSFLLSRGFAAVV